MKTLRVRRRSRNEKNANCRFPGINHISNTVLETFSNEHWPCIDKFISFFKNKLRGTPALRNKEGRYTDYRISRSACFASDTGNYKTCLQCMYAPHSLVFRKQVSISSLLIGCLVKTRNYRFLSLAFISQ